MLLRLKTMVYLVDFSIGLETFGKKNFFAQKPRKMGDPRNRGSRNW